MSTAGTLIPVPPSVPCSRGVAPRRRGPPLSEVPETGELRVSDDAGPEVGLVPLPPVAPPIGHFQRFAGRGHSMGEVVQVQDGPRRTGRGHGDALDDVVDLSHGARCVAESEGDQVLHAGTQGGRAVSGSPERNDGRDDQDGVAEGVALPAARPFDHQTDTLVLSPPAVAGQLLEESKASDPLQRVGSSHSLVIDDLVSFRSGDRNFIDIGELVAPVIQLLQPLQNPGPPGGPGSSEALHLLPDGALDLGVGHARHRQRSAGFCEVVIDDLISFHQDHFPDIDELVLIDLMCS
eukprot:CAMPEP_0203924120 /NCGR_PEP_ID=MMETSP0359-20131031/63920_1 /ASSEMBLY_ACC=CAM_ASM_000338 /TAXON_ID=268821 /ORGANISM="Scrippsiella Hangoei, Strain SHTV-5" /LENGTH=292 /DNA_ID=CAMNT_0050852297 /DNA_START=1 /DNA_END=879 /DNA_ORIENTATION=+